MLALRDLAESKSFNPFSARWLAFHIVLEEGSFMSLQIVCAPAKLLSHRWRLLKAGSTTPEIGVICLFLWSWACSCARVWTLVAKASGWCVGRCQVQRLKSSESWHYTEKSVAHSTQWEMEIGTSSQIADLDITVLQTEKWKHGKHIEKAKEQKVWISFLFVHSSVCKLFLTRSYTLHI